MDGFATPPQKGAACKNGLCQLAHFESFVNHSQEDETLAGMGWNASPEHG
jgi:hypothetical protein